MKKQTKQFERKFISVRNKIERKGVSMAKKMIQAHYLAYMEKLKTLGISAYQQIEIPEAITERFFRMYYPMSAPLAVMTYENMEKQAGQKAEKDVKKAVTNSIFQSKLTELVNSTTKERIRSITNTTEETIRRVINGVLDEADTAGWGVPETTSKIFKAVGQNLIGNGYSRARAIAQTELISASNQASQFAADKAAADYGVTYRKFWSTSGMPNIRDTHLEAEAYSEEKDGLQPDEVFPNGLLYPGDPNGDASEVINCRCTLMQEVFI